MNMDNSKHWRTGGLADLIYTNSYDPETLAAMTKAFDEAWEETGYALASIDFDPTAARTLMALKIMTAVRGGERDPVRLKELALEVVAKAD